jgi:hypothetical protein
MFARFRRTSPRLSAIGRLTSQCVFPCPTKFPGVYFSIYHLLHYCTMFIFTLHSLYTFNTTHYLLPPSTTITYHYQVPHFYHVLNKSSQALVAVSSSGHIRISVYVLTSRYRSHPAFAQFRFTTRDFPALSPYHALRAFPLELSPVDTCFLRFP